VAPSLGPALESASLPRQSSLVDRRVIVVSALAIGVAFVAGFVAEGLGALIALITSVAFHGRPSIAPGTPMGHHLGPLVIAVPVAGAIVVGLLARYGSKAIRGHGIPEAMEQILTNHSRIPARMTFLKPLSAAIAIGTGGPFGAEGPIIATGGALGSLVGQVVRVTAEERKTLLAAGAAAGMAATFGAPVSAVLLAIELLLFEYRPRSIIPVALATATADAVRIALHGAAPVFAMPEIAPPTGEALAAYVVVGLVVGLASVVVTRLVYTIEDAFEKLPVHWMWWPAIGAIAVGVVGYLDPRTLGVGYANIERTLSGELVGRAVGVLCLLKLVSWSISLGSGTSGGTLAPLFTIGGGLGSVLGALAAALLPGAAIEPRVAALVGMAAMFTGASRAMLASVVFAFEITRQPMGLLPLLGGSAGAMLISCLTMRHSIMTEKIARRGTKVAGEYVADFLDQVPVRAVCSPGAVALRADDPVAEARAWLASDAEGSRHQGYPVVDGEGRLIGVITRRDFASAPEGAALVRDLVKRAPAVVRATDSVRQAADHMIAEKVGRLPVVDAGDPSKLVGILTRSDLLRAHERRLDAARHAEIARPVRILGDLARLRARLLSNAR
jgi:chloride channel protein, CIC family